ncbi:uncharacterized protein LOC134187798 [Corticium candelabrum]|uniref:uncharacterized protein LOC134187798 n=1 Tax=Corticium candelabrum TaxID=121492 RepID=UPI002E260C3D|nr:uncharacterized protein LOC134187798 [Corticium candelabrum]
MLDGIMRRMSSSHSVNASEDVASVGSDIPITSKEALSGSFEDRWLKLEAKSLSGQPIQLKAKTLDTIAALKHQLPSQKDSLSWDYLLFHNGKQLHDEQTLADAGLTDGTKLSFVLCPLAVASMGSDVGELFVQAVQQGSVEIVRIKIVIVGRDRTGKTSFKRSLLNEKFQPIEPSTSVAKAELAVCEASNWRRVSDKDREFLDRQIARAAIHVERNASARSSGSEDKSKSVNTKVDQSETAMHSNDDRQSTANDSSEIGTSYDRQNEALTPNDDNERNKSTDEFDEAAALNETIACVMKQFQEDPILLKQEDSKLHIAMWDLGGQEPLLPGQGQAITPGCIVFIVFNAAEPLDEEAKSFYLHSVDSEPIPIQNFWIEKNCDAVSLWASVTSLVGEHHSSDLRSFPLLTDYIGKSKNCASPVMFLIGTHAKDVDEKMIKKQNEFLSKLFHKKAFKKHIIRPTTQPHDWFFCVENSVSDPDSPNEDPGVTVVKQLIEKMACDVSPKPLIPATWSVLEKILDALEAKLGSALSNIKVIMPFANRFCRMSKERELCAALSYLDEAGSVIFPQRSKKLKNIVVTKPRWLFNVFSIVASVCNSSPLLSEAWEQAQETGIVSWDLIDHRLKEAGVKQIEYAIVLNLLNCFFILCSKPGSFAVAVSYQTDYFVPCLLNFVYEGPFSAASPAIPDMPKPLSLIVSSCKIDFIPEQLHFKLMTCCIEKYQENNEPTLARNYSVYQVQKGVKLELIYHLKKYIIVTIDTQKSCREIAPICTDIRRFITETLDEVKKPGLPQLQLSLNIQLCGPTVPVDTNRLVCIDAYKANEDTPLRRNIDRRVVELNHIEKVGLDCWFYDQKDEVIRQTSQHTLELEVNSKCTDEEIVSVAFTISTRWTLLVSLLAPTLFSVYKIHEIERENPIIFMQARTALTMWTSHFGNQANRQILIKTMCDKRVGCRLEANAAFGEQLVTYVSPYRIVL